MTFPRTRKSPVAAGPNRNNYRPQNTATNEPAQVPESSGNSGTNCPDIPKRGRGRPKGFAAAAAAATGRSKRSINRTLRLARILGDDLHKITGTTLDKGVEMEALILLPPEMRAVLIRWAADGQEVSARSACTVAEAALEAFPDGVGGDV